MPVIVLWINNYNNINILIFKKIIYITAQLNVAHAQTTIAIQSNLTTSLKKIKGGLTSYE